MAVGTLKATPAVRAARRSFGPLTECGSERNRGEVDFCHIGDAECDTAVYKESPYGEADTEDRGTAIRELISEVVEIEKSQVRERAYPPGITNRR